MDAVHLSGTHTFLASVLGLVKEKELIGNPKIVSSFTWKHMVVYGSV